jgi:hypothetical protein
MGKFKAVGRDKFGKYEKGKKKSAEEIAKMAEALKGNDNRLKVKSEESQKVVYEIYCQWLAAGRDKRGFVCEYIDENGKENSVTYQTVENYVKKNPSVLDPHKQVCAESKGFACWEYTGIKMLNGEVKGCQPAIYQIFMRNKYGWDKEEKVSTVNESDACRFMEKIENMPDSEKSIDNQ